LKVRIKNHDLRSQQRPAWRRRGRDIPVRLDVRDEKFEIEVAARDVPDGARRLHTFVGAFCEVDAPTKVPSGE
jgi:hypothetical protein